MCPAFSPTFSRTKYRHFWHGNQGDPYLKRLVAAHFVRREIDAGDLRRHRLNLTPAGRKVMVRGLALLSEAFAARLSRLNAAEQTQFADLLEKLGSRSATQPPSIALGGRMGRP